MHIEVLHEDGEFQVWAATEEGEVMELPSFIVGISTDRTAALKAAETDLLEGLSKVRELMKKERR